MSGFVKVIEMMITVCVGFLWRASDSVIVVFTVNDEVYIPRSCLELTVITSYRVLQYYNHASYKP